MEHYIAIGWLDAAIEETNELRRLTGPDSEVDGFIAILSRKPAPPAPLTPPSTSKPAATWYPSQPTKSSKTSRKLPARPAVNMLPSEVDETRKDLTENYPTLRSKAKALFSDLLRLKALQKKYGMSHSDNLSRIQAIAEGRVDGTPTTSGPPGSARSVARMIQTTPDRATEMAIADLEDMTHWLREPHGRASGVDDDSVRDSLVKRMHAVQLALPEDLKLYPEIALMHIQHEQLAKTYVNDETMLGDAIKDIPRDNFWVTEDNYAWDMEELVQAITANGGVMRNPLSRQMFTPKDIRGIVKHPKGKALQALQVAQHEMAKGVRPDTITQMDKLATILLEDQSADTLPSRHAVDEFMAYVATRESPHLTRNAQSVSDISRSTRSRAEGARRSQVSGKGQPHRSVIRLLSRRGCARRSGKPGVLPQNRRLH